MYGNQSALPKNEWHEDEGSVLWWTWPVTEAPWCGTPNDSDWPGYHTHWTTFETPQNTATSKIKWKATMLLDHEKDGIGSKRLARAVAFLEAAGVIDQMHLRMPLTAIAEQAMAKASDELRDMAVAERRAWEDEQHRAAKAVRDI